MSNKDAISQHIFELRFKPNSRILDHRGTWAQHISKELSLSEWIIVENRFDVHDKLKKETVFVGFRNCGYTCKDAPTRNYFPDKGAQFLRLLFSFEEFENPIFVERIGVRTKFITNHAKGFDDLRDRVGSKYITLPEKAMKAISAKLVDIGAPLNFADKQGNFNTSLGPMTKDQISDFIPGRNDYPEVGLFYDIDYWLKPEKELPDSEVLRIMKSFAFEAWDRHERIKDLILGD